MKTNILLVMITLSLFTRLNAQSFENLWKKVNENLENDLPETAESFLDKIEDKAVKENNQKELLKTFLYRFNIIQEKDENPIEASINYAKENISRLQEPEKAIFNVAIAALYNNYYQRNQYIIKNNIPIATDYSKINIKFWDKATFKKVINKYYDNALSDIEALQNCTTISYESVLNINPRSDVEIEFSLEPTLYDYIVHKIINYRSSNGFGFDTDFRYVGVLDLYQRLIDFDKANNFTDAAIYNEVKKLEKEYKHNNDFKLYFNSLETIKNDNKDNSLITSIMLLQAQAILEQDTVNDSAVKALELCDEAIRLFPNSFGSEQCKSLRSSILAKELSFSMQSVVMPNKPIPANISYRNITNPHYKIYKISQDEVENFSSRTHDYIVKELLSKTPIIENSITIPEEKDYLKHSSLIALPELECGIYYILFSKDNNFSTEIEKTPALHHFQVSNLSYVTTKENDDFVIYVLDRESGKAVKDVNVNVYQREYIHSKRKYLKDTLHNLITDNNGRAVISKPTKNSFHIDISKGNDKLFSDSYFYNQDKRTSRQKEHTYFYTDRAIYRPGQTVYYKGITLNENSEKKDLVVGKQFTIIFRDANRQTISEKKVTTDEFASFEGSFVIPNNLSNGQFSIVNESGIIDFTVEEYKRPTFEIIFNEPDKSFKINDRVSLSGSVKAYAGFGLDNINYEYTIKRRHFYPYRYWWYANYHSDNEEQIAFGDGQTDVNGNFNIDFKLIAEQGELDRLPVFEYIVSVKASSNQGETQTMTYTLRAAEIDLIIDIKDNYSYFDIDSIDKATFTVKNLKENPVEAKIIRKIYKVEDNCKFISDDYNLDRKLLTDDELNTLFPHFDYYANKKQAKGNRMELISEDVMDVNGESELFPNIKGLIKTGKYIVELVSADNEKARLSQEINIVDATSNKMPFNDLCLSYYHKEKATVGEEVNFYLGTSAENVNVIYMIKHGDKIRRYEHKTLSDKVLDISYKIKEEDRGEIVFQAFFVKYNTINIVEHTVYIPYDNLELDIQLDVERDNLLPGSHERWNLTVKDYKDKSVIANLMAGMYDASLDVFAKNKWHFSTHPSIVSSTSIETDNSNYHFLCIAYTNYYTVLEVFNYDLLSNIPLTSRVYRNRFGRSNVMYSLAPSDNDILYSTMKANVDYDDSSDDIDIFSSSEESVETDKFNNDISIRENFNETAFFYPNMKTNEDGSLTVSFTMPDALTRWNLMMMAYTKDLKVGTLNKTFTTSKPLMIMSDMPRFCYENDTLWMVANVVRNTESDDVFEVKAKLEIFDALTMKPLDLILSEQEVSISDIPAGESRAVRWKVAFRNDMNLLAFRFSASAENFSDAEQHLIPILSDEVFMTETYPMTVKANSTEKLDLDFEVNNERNQGFTLNFCPNPIWYAIQSLPYISKETGEHADVAFNNFYVNSLASHIAHSIPNLLNYIKKWQIDSPDVLMSQLEKDENLKAIMLKETPWVMEAKSESEQKSRIANLFDINTLNNKTDEALDLIKKKQSVNGGWSWFPKMPESPFITQYILGGFGKLYKMNVINDLDDEQKDIVEDICKSASDYLRDDVIEYRSMIKDTNKYHVYNYQIINELYALSFFDFEKKSKYEKAEAFFIKKLQKDWHGFDYATQAKIALVLFRNKKTETAQLIIQSLKERARKSESIGMYWTSNVREHTIIMEAFREIAPDAHLLEEMNIWLLCNKRTNMWVNASTSVNAIYQLMCGREMNEVSCKLSDVNAQHLELVIDSQQTTDSSQQTMFLQKYWTAEEMMGLKEFGVDNKTDDLVWGGLFRQYFVPVDEVRKHESPLNIEREIFVERVNESGTYLVPIKDTQLKVGDKIVVNLIVESPQDIEFVFLKDLRAACLEPEEQMSQYRFYDGMLYYQSNSDTYMGFYFDWLSKGKHQLSYSMYVTKEGSFSNGYALIQCMYSPEFSAYSEGMRVKVVD